jgi:hypothetical protein
VYGYASDENSGELLFSKSTWGALASLELHIQKGCLSDHPDIPLYYFPPGFEDILEFLCGRGTSPLEAYHSHANTIVSATNSSPELTEHAVREWNFRWNILMAILHRGMSDLGHFRHELVEEIRQWTKSWFDKELYADIPIVNEFSDTKEVFGIQIQEHSADPPRLAEGLRSSEAFLANRQGTSIPVTSSAINSDEIKFIKQCLLNPACYSAGMLDMIAIERIWKAELELMRRKETSIKNLRHVTAQVLETLFSEFKKIQNESGSYQPIAQEDRALQLALRKVQHTHIESNSSLPQPTAPVSDIEEKDKSVIHVPPRIFGQDREGHVPLPNIVPPSNPPPPISSDTAGSSTAAAPRKRAPKHCSTCGQTKDLEPWSNYHKNKKARKGDPDFCTTPIDQYSASTRPRPRNAAPPAQSANNPPL